MYVYFDNLICFRGPCCLHLLHGSGGRGF